MKYPRILSHFYGQPWAITEAKHKEIEAFLRRKAADLPGAFDDDDDFPSGGRARGYQMSGRTAIVPLLGVLMNRCGTLDQMSGCVSSEELGATIDGLAGDSAVQSIVLLVDSPGGTVAGTPELADRVARAAASKKLFAIADSMAASAAYYVASQASRVFASPSALVGSIGVIASHFDDTAAEEQDGFKTTYVTAGKYKGEGYEPITEPGRAYMQSMVDQMYTDFVKVVAKGRGVAQATVRGETWGQGRILTAADALAVGMVDEIATLESVLRRLESGSGSRGAKAELPSRNALIAAARARAVGLDG